MNCMGCIMGLRGNNQTCRDIFNLLSILGIPVHEQIILWNIALENISSAKFRELLYALIARTKDATSNLSFGTHLE